MLSNEEILKQDYRFSIIDRLRGLPTSYLFPYEEELDKLFYAPSNERKKRVGEIIEKK